LKTSSSENRWLASLWRNSFDRKSVFEIPNCATVIAYRPSIDICGGGDYSTSQCGTLDDDDGKNNHCSVDGAPLASRLFYRGDA
jgi:hypothetical protein